MAQRLPSNSSPVPVRSTHSRYTFFVLLLPVVGPNTLSSHSTVSLSFFLQKIVFGNCGFVLIVKLTLESLTVTAEPSASTLSNTTFSAQCDSNRKQRLFP
jgi:hypothetical protein